MIVNNTVAAVYFFADCAVPSKRPNSKAGPKFKRLFWDDATQEQKDNLTWIEGSPFGAYTILPLTKEEEHEIWLDMQFHLRQILNYVLKHHNYETYLKVVEAYKDRFNEYEVDTNDEFPHCKYAEGGQCDLFCKYYERGDCRYETALD